MGSTSAQMTAGQSASTVPHLTEGLLPRLILDYLSHNGYSETARAFASRSNTSSSAPSSIPAHIISPSNLTTSFSNDNGTPRLPIPKPPATETADDDVLMSSTVDLSVTPRASNGFASLDRTTTSDIGAGLGIPSFVSSTTSGTSPAEQSTVGAGGMDIDPDITGEEDEDKRVEGMLIGGGGMSPPDPDGDVIRASNGKGKGRAEGNGNGGGVGGIGNVDDKGGLSEVREEEVERMVKQIEARGLIRHYICNSNIPSAIQTIQTHFSTIIDDSKVPYRMIDAELTCAPPPETLKQFAGKALSHPVYQISSYPDAPSATSSGSPTETETENQTPPFPFQHVFNNPRYLSLNLEIQSLVDGVRNMVIPNSPSPSTSGSMASSFHSDVGMGSAGGAGMMGLTSQAIAIKGGDGGAHSPGNGYNNGNGNGNGNGHSNIPKPEENVSTVVAKAKALYERLKSLNPDELAVYTRAVDDVAGLLAYVDMEDSPLGGYLDQGRREALANQVDRSIMVSLGREPKPLLDTMIRQISLFWDKMQEGEVDCVPDFTEDKDGFAASQLAKTLKYQGWHGIQALIADGQ